MQPQEHVQDTGRHPCAQAHGYAHVHIHARVHVHTHANTHPGLSLLQQHQAPITPHPTGPRSQGSAPRDPPSRTYSRAARPEQRFSHPLCTRSLAHKTQVPKGRPCAVWLGSAQHSLAQLRHFLQSLQASSTAGAGRAGGGARCSGTRGRRLWGTRPRHPAVTKMSPNEIFLTPPLPRQPSWWSRRGSPGLKHELSLQATGGTGSSWGCAHSL